MEQSMLNAAQSPSGGASITSEMVKQNPGRGRKAILKVGEEVILLMSKSPQDLADLFEWVDKETRRVLYQKITLDALEIYRDLQVTGGVL